MPQSCAASRGLRLAAGWRPAGRPPPCSHVSRALAIFLRVLFRVFLFLPGAVSGVLRVLFPSALFLLPGAFLFLSFFSAFLRQGLGVRAPFLSPWRGIPCPVRAPFRDAPLPVPLPFP